MGIAVDGVANEIYGLDDFGSGLIQTPHFSVLEPDIAALNGLRLFVDHRPPGTYTGMEFDNLRPLDNTDSPVPEPTSYLLLGTGIAGLVRLRRRYYKR